MELLTNTQLATKYKIKQKGLWATDAQENKIDYLMSGLGLMGEERDAYLKKMGFEGRLTKEEASLVIQALIKEVRRGR